MVLYGMRIGIQFIKKNMKKKFLFSSLVLLHQCNLGYDGGRYMDFYNNSGSPVCYFMPFEYGVFYPDTILPKGEIEPHKFNKEIHFSLAYHEDALFEMLPADTMSIFFFDPDTLSKYDWETIRAEYNILVRYDLSHTDLKKMEWYIYYPPTEAMKDMKMYPPYGDMNGKK